MDVPRIIWAHKRAIISLPLISLVRSGSDVFGKSEDVSILMRDQRRRIDHCQTHSCFTHFYEMGPLPWHCTITMQFRQLRYVHSLRHQRRLQPPPRPLSHQRDCDRLVALCCFQFPHPPLSCTQRAMKDHLLYCQPSCSEFVKEVMIQRKIEMYTNLEVTWLIPLSRCFDFFKAIGMADSVALGLLRRRDGDESIVIFAVLRTFALERICCGGKNIDKFTWRVQHPRFLLGLVPRSYPD